MNNPGSGRFPERLAALPAGVFRRIEDSLQAHRQDLSSLKRRLALDVSLVCLGACPSNAIYVHKTAAGPGPPHDVA